MKLWLLFKSHLCVSWQLSGWGSGFKFWPAFLGVVSISALFSKPFAIWFCTTESTKWPIWDMGSSAFKVCHMLFRSDPYMCSSGVSQRVHEQLYGVTLPSSFLSAFFLVPSSLPGSPLSVYSQKHWNLFTVFYHILFTTAPVSGVRWWEGREREREKATWGFSTFSLLWNSPLFRS